MSVDFWNPEVQEELICFSYVVIVLKYPKILRMRMRMRMRSVKLVELRGVTAPVV